MRDNGKQLEGLVALIEKLHLPPAFDVKTNERVFYQGIQVAEFDIEIRGRLGTTDVVWLIECRDRPTEGPAPASWIEQLVGRRTRFGFNKVTAVSTTGFSKGASDFAQKEGIETREVRTLAPEHIADWLPIRSITQFKESGELHNASLFVGANETEERKEALRQALLEKRLSDDILRSVETNEKVSVLAAFAAAVGQKHELYDLIRPNQSEMAINLRVSYPDDTNHFAVDTGLGPVRIRDIVFVGKLTRKKTEIPLLDVREYTRVPSGESISQSAAFAFDAWDTKLSLEMHKLTGSSGETQIVLRKLGKVR